MYIPEQHIENFSGDLDEAIDFLEKAKNAGLRLSLRYWDVELHSDNISVDGAYKAVTGMTKEEFIKARQEWLENLKKERAEKKQQAHEKIPEWIKKGNQMIYPEKKEEWEKCVRTRADDLYFGEELDDALEIMWEIHCFADIKDIERVFAKQDHSGISANMVMSIVANFSRLGPQVVRSMAKDGVIDSFDEEYLKKIEEQNKVYKEKEDKAWHDRSEEEERRKKAEALAKVPEWIEEGNKLIYPERQEEWKNFVEGNAKSGGSMVHDVLQLMKSLDQGGDISETLNIFRNEQGHSGVSESWCTSIVARFSKRGPEFARAARGGWLGEEDLKQLDELEKQNAEFEANLGSGKSY